MKNPPPFTKRFPTHYDIWFSHLPLREERWNSDSSTGGNENLELLGKSRSCPPATLPVLGPRHSIRQLTMVMVGASFVRISVYFYRFCSSLRKMIAMRQSGGSVYEVLTPWWGRRGKLGMLLQLLLCGSFLVPSSVSLKWWWVSGSWLANCLECDQSWAFLKLGSVGHCIYF